MSNPATRLITLILLLQRRPNQKAAELARELGVSVRTLHRYFAMLDELGIPVYAERGPYGGFSLVRGYRMPPLVLTPQEAVAVYLGTRLVEEVWGPLYREAAAGVLAKIEATLPDEQRQEIAWARQTLLALGLQRADFAALAAQMDPLKRATREHRRVSMVYQSTRQAEPTARELDPYALVHRYGWWYVIGFCHLRQEVRSFRIDRIQTLTLLAASFDPPEGFNLQAYLADEFRAQPEIEARLRFSRPMAHLALENRTLWKAVEKEPGGTLLVTLSTPELTWAASLALSYGPAVQVVAPDELRRMVHDWAQAVVNQYEKPNP